MSPTTKHACAGEVLQLSMPWEITAVRTFVRQVVDFLEQQGVDPETRGDAEIAITEAANNLILHADALPEGSSITLAVQYVPPLIEMRLTDNSSGFEFPQQISLPEEGSEGGRGLFLIKSVTDELRYLRGPGENCLIMRLRRPSGGDRIPPHDEGDKLRLRLRENERIIQAMTDDLSACYESLSAIFRFVSHIVPST